MSPLYRLATRGLMVLTVVCLTSVLGPPPLPTMAARSDCSSNFAVDVTLANGARWEMCWEARAREGIVLHNIYYTPPGGIGPRRLVLHSASLAEAFIPYDDGTPRFYDLSGYGLGGKHLNSVAAVECPGGVLISNGEKNVLCRQILSRGFAYKSGTVQRQAQKLKLFSLSQVGNYHYVIAWEFYDDGVMVPSTQVTGTLHSDVSNTTYGWPIGIGSNDYRTSHAHTHYWRLDFDVNLSANDVVEELSFMGSGSSRRELATTMLFTEARRATSASSYRFWRVKDTATTNPDGHQISYEIQPQTHHVLRAAELWTLYDVYVTTHKACEQLMANNIAAGCPTNAYDYVDGEEVVDVVVWVGVTYHHVARDEDQGRVQVDHTLSVELIPRDWTFRSPP